MDISFDIFHLGMRQEFFKSLPATTTNHLGSYTAATTASAIHDVLVCLQLAHSSSGQAQHSCMGPRISDPNPAIQTELTKSHVLCSATIRSYCLTI